MKKIITTLFTITLVFISYRSLTNSAGPPVSVTNAPGEGTCSNCHGPNVTSGTVWNGMSLSVVGATLGTLVQNTTYTFNLTFTDASSIKYGFELCVLPAGANSATTSLGTLISTTSLTQIVSSVDRDYLEHTSTGTSALSGTKTWTFDWTTPASYTGGATFYVVVNSTNSSTTNDFGDEIYPKTFAATVIMPVAWLYTNAKMDKEGVSINWATASEENNWKFEIEKSIDQKEWSTIGEVKGMGSSSMVSKYSFRDESVVNGTAYYRVKQIDFNGKYSYSDMVSVKAGIDNEEPTISYNADKLGYVVRGNKITDIQVTNMNGESKYTASGDCDEQVIPSLVPGVYLVQIHTASNTYYQKVLMH